MTAPGLNLEFSGSPDYRRRVRALPSLAFEVKEILASRPDAGRDQGGGIRALRLSFNGVEFGVIYRRDMNKIGLMALYQLPDEEALFVGKIQDLSKLFGQR